MVSSIIHNEGNDILSTPKFTSKARVVIEKLRQEWRVALISDEASYEIDTKLANEFLEIRNKFDRKHKASRAVMKWIYIK